MFLWSYITYINATDGIKIHNSSDTTNYARVNSDGLQVYKSDTQVASFGSTVQIGPNNNYHITIDGNGMNFLPADGGYGGAKFGTHIQGMNITVNGSNKPSRPTASSRFNIQNWTTSLVCEDNSSSGKYFGTVSLDDFSSMTRAQIYVGQVPGNVEAPSAEIELTHFKNKEWNAFDKGTISIGASSYGCQINMTTDVNIKNYNSPYDDNSGIYGPSYLYFSSYRSSKSTSSYGNVGIFSDSTRYDKGLSQYYFGLISGSSSKRYKHNISSLIDASIDPRNLYKAEVVQFFYNDSYIDKNDLRYGIPLPGFIAEDLYKAYPVAIDFNEKGEIETWNERYIIPPMLKLIQEQHQEIEQLKKDIIDLKRRVK